MSAGLLNTPTVVSTSVSAAPTNMPPLPPPGPPAVPPLQIIRHMYATEYRVPAQHPPPPPRVASLPWSHLMSPPPPLVIPPPQIGFSGGAPVLPMAQLLPAKVPLASTTRMPPIPVVRHYLPPKKLRLKKYTPLMALFVPPASKPMVSVAAVSNPFTGALRVFQSGAVTIERPVSPPGLQKCHFCSRVLLRRVVELINALLFFVIIF